MDISRLKEIKNQIAELEEKSRKTDSKRESFQYDQQVRELEREFGELVDKGLEEVPSEVNIRVKVDKIVKFDTIDFKNYLIDNMLHNINLDSFDISEELRTEINEDFDYTWEIDAEDIHITLEDDRLK